ncbi:MAG: DMT family transporter [Alphaproteobacteria bacterium]|nr:DMT family transporter [Alphaproteobacteria bacterium]
MKRGSMAGYVLALTAVFLWSQNILLAQGFKDRILPLEFAFGRWVIALMILLPMGGRNVWWYRAYFWKKEMWLMGLALSGIVLTNTLIYVAARTTDPVTISLLNLPAPIFLATLTAVFLKQKIGIGGAVGMAIAVGGVLVILMSGGDGTGPIEFKIGDIWMILNALCFAVYSFLQTKRPTFISQTTLLTATVLMGVIMLTPAFFWFDWGHARTLGVKEWGVLAFLGVFNSVLAYLAWNSALTRIGPVKTGIIFYLQPVFSILGAALFFRTGISPAQIGGGAIIVLGIYLVGRFQGISQRELRKN